MGDVTYTRRIEIRLVQTEEKRYEKGKVIRTPGPDPLRLGELVRADLERAVQEKYGTDTAVSFAVGQAKDIRLHGTFPEKAPVIRQWVQEILAEALENIDAIDE